MSGSLRRVGKVGLAAAGVLGGGALLYNSVQPQVPGVYKVPYYLFFKSDGEQYQIVKKGRKYHCCGEEYYVNIEAVDKNIEGKTVRSGKVNVKGNVQDSHLVAGGGGFTVAFFKIFS